MPVLESTFRACRRIGGTYRALSCSCRTIVACAAVNALAPWMSAARSWLLITSATSPNARMRSATSSSRMARPASVSSSRVGSPIARCGTAGNQAGLGEVVAEAARGGGDQAEVVAEFTHHARAATIERLKGPQRRETDADFCVF